MNETPNTQLEPRDSELRNDATPVVEFRDVGKTWNPQTPNEFTALSGVSFCVDDKHGQGELITVVGPSGCGKSTLLNLIAGFADVCPPTSGEVLVRGKQVTGPGKDRGMVFQKYSSFPHLTVRENAAFGLQLNRGQSGLSSFEIRELADEWLEKVGLTGHGNKYPHQLSGGQQQRVAIARTLAVKPRILLMDEPFSALDEPTRFEMQALLVSLWSEVEATIFVVTHSIAEAVYLGDRLWLMKNAPNNLFREFSHVPIPVPGESPSQAQKDLNFIEITKEIESEFDKLSAD